MGPQTWLSDRALDKQVVKKTSNVHIHNILNVPKLK